MRVTDGFRTFVLEQLADVEFVWARAMFGGVGLYADDVFFGILAANTLYLKVDDSNRAQYEAEGMTAFQSYAGACAVDCWQRDVKTLRCSKLQPKKCL